MFKIDYNNVVFLGFKMFHPKINLVYFRMDNLWLLNKILGVGEVKQFIVIIITK